MATLSRTAIVLAIAGARGAAALEHMCPGSINVAGHGLCHLTAAAWNSPGIPAGPVVAVGGGVQPMMWGRAYFADTCADDSYENTRYASMKLLGKRLVYTTDISRGGCGCNAAMYLVSMKQNTEESACFDYYCDANSVCGPNCAEIDIQEANKFAWHSTLHKSWDGSGVSAGYGGWVHNNNHYDFGPEEYGPGAKCINTNLPFQVSTAFPARDDGKLKAMEVTLSQNGCTLHMPIESYEADPGFDLITRALQEGMTPVVSYWKSPEMLWLDGPGVGAGPCREDSLLCEAPPSFYNFAVENL